MKASLNLWYVLCFVLLFTLGGTTGVVLCSTAVDVALHDSYYVIAHFRFVLSLGAIIGLVCGFFYYQGSIFGSTANIFTRKISDSPYSRALSIVFLFGTCLTSIPMHILGSNVMPRRIPGYPHFITYVNTMRFLGSLSTIAFLKSIFEQ